MNKLLPKNDYVEVSSGTSAEEFVYFWCPKLNACFVKSVVLLSHGEGVCHALDWFYYKLFKN